MVDQELASNVTDAGDLEKLPLETRKQIYTHLLVEPKTIAIKHYTNPKAYTVGEVARMNHRRRPDRNKTVYIRRLKIRVDAPHSTTSILPANKLVGQEATPVFYGSNKFLFDSAGALRDFLLWIGQSRQHLRHVEVDGRGIMYNASWSAMDRSSSLLEPAKGLRALHFYHIGFCGVHVCNRANIGEVAAHCSPLLPALKATWEARNVNMDVLDVVKIVLPPCHCKSCPQPGKRCKNPACRKPYTHRYRWITMPGGGKSGESHHWCACLCEAAEDENRSFNEKLKGEITRYLGLESLEDDCKDA